jgi:hypothetical protein
MCVWQEYMIEMSNEEPPLKRPRMEHPAIADPRWLDVSFLCGPHKKGIKVNRPVLESMNPVLQRVLFGTGLISVDPSTSPSSGLTLMIRPSDKLFWLFFIVARQSL